MSLNIVSHKPLQRKSRSHRVTWLTATMCKVESGESGRAYLVRFNGEMGATCTCPWGQRGGVAERPESGCSHVIEAFNDFDAQRTVSAWGTMADARRQHQPIEDIGNGVLITKALNKRNGKPKVNGVLTQGIDEGI